MADAPLDTSTIDRAKAYADTRARMTELVTDLDEAGAATPVPACPRWTVKDVVAHAAGVCADILNGNLDGVATDPWTDAQVRARKDRSLKEIVAEWSELAPQVEAVVGAFPPAAASQLVFDLVTHEHDLRAALGAPGARDSEAVAIGAEFGVLGLTLSRPADAPPLRIASAGQTWGPDGGATLEAEPFDLMRSCSGRRTLDQIRGLKWQGDPEPHLAHFGFAPFTVPEAAVDA